MRLVRASFSASRSYWRFQQLLFVRKHQRRQKNPIRWRRCNTAASDLIAAGAVRQSQAFLRSRLFFTTARREAAFGSLLTAASTGSRLAMARCSAPDRWARSRWPIRIPTRSMSAWVSRRFAGTFRMAMVFTSQLTRARRGSASVLKTHDRSRAFVFIRRTRTSFTSRRWAMFGDRTISAACFGPKMVARRGRRSWTGATKPARSIWLSIRLIQTSSTRVSGRFIASPGRSRVVGQAVASLNRLTAAIRGLSWRATTVCRKERSEKLALPFHLQIRNASGRLSKRKTAVCFVLITAARVGPGWTKSGACASVPGTTRVSMPIRRMPTPFTF